MVGSDGKMLITMEALGEAFGSGVAWDLSGLTLRLSSTASFFETSRYREPVGMESPLEVLFPRQCTLLGWVHIGYARLLQNFLRKHILSRINIILYILSNL